MCSNNIISQKWINNIKKLDGKYNLVLGKIYANDNSIHDLEITGNTVRAKVRKAPDETYNVEIEFREFESEEKNKIIELAKKNPLIYFKLLNKELPDVLFNSDIKIFPDSLDDFKISCDCGRGLFCKHQAAVFHKISEEISLNPFLVFSLRGFDLNTLLPDTFKIKDIHEVLYDKSGIVLNESGDINYLVKLNLMLSDYPSFYSSGSVNFNEVLCDTLASMSKCIFQIHDSKVDDEFQELIVLGNYIKPFELFVSKSLKEIEESFQDKWEYPKQWDGMTIDLNGNYDISKISTGKFDNNFRSDLKYALFAFLAEINQIDISFHCDEIRFLNELYLFVSKLININALIPEFFRLDNDEYHIRWIPVFEKRIYEDLEYFIEICPPNLLTFNGNKLSRKNQVISLISLLFEGFCQYYVNKFIPSSLKSFKNETFFRLFFIKSQDLSNYVFKGKEREVDNWLCVLFSSQSDYDLVIDTVQSNHKFSLQLKIRLNSSLYDFSDIVELKRWDIVKAIPVIQNIISKSSMSLNFLEDNPMNLHQYSYFLDSIAPVLGECGIEVNTPEEFRNKSDAKLILNLNRKEATSSLTLNDLVDFDWKIAIGDDKFSIEEFEAFSSNYRGLVKTKDNYVLVDEENLNRLMEDISRIPENPDKSEMISYLLGSDSDNVELDDKFEALLNTMLNVEESEVPKTLNGTLRNYQKTGFSWMIQNMQLGFGSILADDMGLGKTIQILTLILYLKQHNKLKNEKVLIVVPTSILTNWIMEIEKFAPSLDVEVYYGMNRFFTDNDYDILLTSYGVLRRDIDDFRDSSWFLIVADEAQNIKNPNSKRTKAVKSINAKYHIALSGTPVENHLAEYWSLFDFTNQGYLKSLKNFKKKFIKPIEKQRNIEVSQDFKKITSPFILRRLKTDTDIVKELPDKIINDIYCNLSLKQASMYDETLNQMIDDIANSEGIQRKGLVLKLINALKQICNHPSQFLKSDDARISESGKMGVLMDILETIIESDEKVLIFTQYVQMGKIMKKLIEEKFSQEVLFLHGGVKRNRRDKMIDEFQNGDAKIFILSLKAGGTGLNLTAASNVIHYDLWWNPAVENQATDRAYRIGQTKNVMVYRFITKGTLEERINNILIEKRQLVEMAIEGNESFITEMSNEELREMLDLRK